MPDYQIPYEADSSARLELDARYRRELVAANSGARSELDASSWGRKDEVP